MTPDAASQQPPVPIGGDLDDVYKRLVRIHQGLAEPTNADVYKVRPWALGELMALIREVRAFQQEHSTP